jgi:hypothetical protein
MPTHGYILGCGDASRPSSTHLVELPSPHAVFTRRNRFCRMVGSAEVYSAGKAQNRGTSQSVPFCLIPTFLGVRKPPALGKSLKPVKARVAKPIYLLRTRSFACESSASRFSNGSTYALTRVSRDITWSIRFASAISGRTSAGSILGETYASA